MIKRFNYIFDRAIVIVPAVTFVLAAVYYRDMLLGPILAAGAFGIVLYAAAYGLGLLIQKYGDKRD